LIGLVRGLFFGFFFIAYGASRTVHSGFDCAAPLMTVAANPPDRFGIINHNFSWGQFPIGGWVPFPDKVRCLLKKAILII
jgi:hypothetical protein